MKKRTDILPRTFKPLLWSYDFSKIDPRRDKRVIVLQALNYGDLPHWRWIVRYYGMEEVQNVIRNMRVTELRPPVRRLVSILLHVSSSNVAPRGT